MSYWDTSTLVKLYAQEPNSGAFENYALSTLPGVKRFADGFPNGSRPPTVRVSPRRLLQF